MKSNLIGFGLMILGMLLYGNTQIPLFTVLMFVGVFLFASLPEEAMFLDYIMEDGNKALLRKRRYIVFLPFMFVSKFLTLGRGVLKIVWKEEYFIGELAAENQVTKKQISRAEYIALRNQQRVLYSTGCVSAEFIEKNYTEEMIGFKRKKRRLIAASVLAGVMLLMLVEPGGFYLTLIYEAVFLPMVLLWIPEYKDAKILQEAYNRAGMCVKE